MANLDTIHLRASATTEGEVGGSRGYLDNYLEYQLQDCSNPFHLRT
ncbi:hypothetical protein SNOG_11345 [Parastagonospora nodorum SN15]|uniref:Uncharacterized protein n=1 Tax=Phaeosphaeria nodorum (strain SN15 / ATCC MYA-4574 / FGSC 10173) TaxID=321614 RepID=Q0UA69_PHANO|nr:hypothetical protein SNOG_11345 [Parastagonospora nodorum SN15]EAT81053.1 hypothetical protein SNOG_11345 [Parastagonospora nodorum SN15]